MRAYVRLYIHTYIFAILLAGVMLGIPVYLQKSLCGCVCFVAGPGKKRHSTVAILFCGGTSLEEMPEELSGRVTGPMKNLLVC